MSASDVSIEVNSDPVLLGLLRDAVRAYLNASEFAQDRVLEVVLAVDEVCSNSIRHAYRGEAGHVLSLSMAKTDGWLEFVVRDDGECRPADMAETKPAPQSIEEATIGGYGIHIVREVCDEVKFETREPKGNLVTVRVKRAPKAGVGDRETA